MPISNRIQRLEETLGVGARVIVISRLQDMTDEELESFLASRGISTRTDDLIVSLKRLGEGHPEPWVMIDGGPTATRAPDPQRTAMN